MSDSISDISLLNLVIFKTIKKREDRKLHRTKVGHTLITHHEMMKSCTTYLLSARSQYVE